MHEVMNHTGWLGLVKRYSLTATLVGAAMMPLLGCKGGDSGSPDKGGETTTGPEGQGEVSNITGSIKINGSSTVLPISNAMKEQFAKEYPGVEISVSGDGTGTGFKEFYAKSTDISDASRPIKAGELEKCNEAGVEFIELPVAYDGLTVVIHPENDWATELTVDQLKKIFVNAEDKPKKWSDVDASWPAEDIGLYAPGTGSGTYDYFKEVVVGKSEAEMRDDMSLNEDDNQLVKGVAGSKFAIGFFGVAYYEENKDKLTAVKIVNPADNVAYEPSSDNIASGKYAPFSRPLFIYVSTASLPRAEVSAFVQFYLDNAQEVSEAVAYVRLPDTIMERAQTHLDSTLTGTHYIDADGNARQGAVEDIYVKENLE